MQVVVIEGETFRVERFRAVKGKGRTLGEFSNQDGRGRERVAAYLERKRHILVDRIVETPQGQQYRSLPLKLPQTAHRLPTPAHPKEQQ